jgi:hypothetical protein
MCTHIHQNHTAFVESIKNKIRLTTIQEYKDDAPNFLRALQDDLGLISSMGNIDAENNDLIPHILLQLQCTKIPLFQQAILHWHRQYMEGKLQLTPLKLIQMADEESQILKHSQQWVEKIGPSITALQAQLEEKSQTSLDVIKHITAHLGFTPSSRAPPGNHYYSPHYNKNRCLTEEVFMMFPSTFLRLDITKADIGIFAQNAAKMGNGYARIATIPIGPTTALRTTILTVIA